MSSWGNAFSDIFRGDEESPQEPGFVEKLEDDQFDEIEVGNLPDGKQVDVREKGELEVLVINLSEIPAEQVYRASDSFSEAHEAQNGFSMKSGSSISSTFKREPSGGSIHTICEFYHGKVPERYNPIITEAMVLRIAEKERNLSRAEVRDRKRQMRRNHGNDAYAVASICSAGYLDKDRFFQNLYTKMVERGSYVVADYAEVFDVFVSEKPFVVFVKGDDSYKQIYHEVLSRSMKLGDYEIDLDFIDIRSKGRNARDIAEQSLDYFREYHDGLEYEESMHDDHYAIRIDPDTI